MGLKEKRYRERGPRPVWNFTLAFFFWGKGGVCLGGDMVKIIPSVGLGLLYWGGIKIKNFSRVHSLHVWWQGCSLGPCRGCPRRWCRGCCSLSVPKCIRPALCLRVFLGGQSRTCVLAIVFWMCHQSAQRRSLQSQGLPWASTAAPAFNTLLLCFDTSTFMFGRHEYDS